MTRLATFAILYMAAILLELLDASRGASAAVPALLLAGTVLVLGLTRVTFLAFLACTTGYFLLADFPDVANHVNIEIYCNLLLMAGIGYSLVRRREYPTDDAAYEMLRPLLQTSLVLVYALAGFAKLNPDFFNPEVSCAGDVLAPLLGGSRLGATPKAFLVLLAALPVADRLLATSVWRDRLTPAARVGAMAAVVLTGALALRMGMAAPRDVLALLIPLLAAAVILWELVGGPLLAVPRLQLAIVALSLVMHMTLALTSLVDFGALAVALLSTFVPASYFALMSRPVRVLRHGPPLQRAHVYLAICVAAGMFANVRRSLTAGLLFNAAVLVLLWPMLVAAVSPAPKPAWRGLPLWSGATPRWMAVFPVLLLLYGLTSYLGLRSAGNFTMFSNLRTEGERSNHFLLGSNPLKRWSYQEDAVRFIRIDDKAARIGYQYHPLQDHRLPVVEFRKLIYQWTRAGAQVPLTFEYRGEVHSTEDIVNDPRWRTDRRDWRMRLLDFRAIQEEGANRCRW